STLLYSTRPPIGSEFPEGAASRPGWMRSVRSCLLSGQIRRSQSGFPQFGRRRRSSTGNSFAKIVGYFLLGAPVCLCPRSDRSIVGCVSKRWREVQDTFEKLARPCKVRSPLRSAKDVARRLSNGACGLHFHAGLAEALQSARV